MPLEVIVFSKCPCNKKLIVGVGSRTEPPSLHANDIPIDSLHLCDILYVFALKCSLVFICNLCCDKTGHLAFLSLFSKDKVIGKALLEGSNTNEIYTIHHCPYNSIGFQIHKT